MIISVVVPTYRRIADLERCLRSLEVQEQPADEVVLVVREDDRSSIDLASGWSSRLPIVVVKVEQPGQVLALNTGVAASRGDIVAITDDDAAPRRDWLMRIRRHFEEDERVGAVGGRDWLHFDSGTIEENAETVATITWYGRLVGNHHLGFGPAREVNFLKGANMSYRRTAIKDLQFDPRLRGKGAQVCNDLAFSLAVRRRGWKVIYDPKVAVDHYPALRPEGDDRNSLRLDAIEDEAFNQYLALTNASSSVPGQGAACRWNDLVGNKMHPGYVHLLLGLLRRNADVIDRWRTARHGRMQARALARKVQA